MTDLPDSWGPRRPSTVGRAIAGLVTGAIIGFFVLGIGARISMRMIATSAGMQAGFSLLGTVEVMLYAGLLGAPVGMLFALFHHRMPGHHLAKGVVYSAILLAVTWLTLPTPIRATAYGLTERAALMMVVFGASALAYGVMVAWVLERLERRLDREFDLVRRYTVNVAAPIEAVFLRLSDIEAYSDWLPGSGIHVGVRLTSEPPIRDGSTYVDRARNAKLDGLILRYQPPSALAFRQTAQLRALPGAPGFVAEVRYSLHAAEDRVEVTRDYRMGMTGGYRWLTPFARRKVLAENTRIMACLTASFEDPTDEDVT